MHQRTIDVTPYAQLAHAVTSNRRLCQIRHWHCSDATFALSLDIDLRPKRDVDPFVTCDTA